MGWSSVRRKGGEGGLVPFLPWGLIFRGGVVIAF